MSHQAHNGLRGIERVPDIELESTPWYASLRQEDARLQNAGVVVEYNLLHNHWKIAKDEVVFRDRFGRGTAEVEIVHPVRWLGSTTMGNSFMVSSSGKMIPLVFSDGVLPPKNPLLGGIIDVISRFDLFNELGFTFLAEPRQSADEKQLVRVELPVQGEDRALRTEYLPPSHLPQVKYKLTNFSFVRASGTCKSQCVTGNCEVMTWCLPVELDGGGYSHRQVTTHNAGHEVQRVSSR